MRMDGEAQKTVNYVFLVLFFFKALTRFGGALRKTVGH